MMEVEKRLEVLTESGGWRCERVTYEDEETEPFRVYVTLRYDIHETEDGLL